MFSNALQILLDLFYPPSCRMCGCDGVWLCANCLAAAGPAIHLNNPAPSIDVLSCLGSYDNPTLKKTIQELKYSGGRVLVNALGQAIGTTIAAGIDASCIIPVPLHPSRLRSRGFNQAELLARSIAAALHLPVSRLAIRTRNTVPQVTLNEHQRAKNVVGAFSLVPDVDFVPEHGIIVDDVFTTGATMSSVAGVLRGHGMKRITALTVAKG